MHCEGCARAVTKVLSKLKGVKNVQTDVSTQKVTVSSTENQQTLLETISKTGKECRIWEEQDLQ